MTLNPTHRSFAAFLNDVAPALRPVCAALRQTIVELHLTAVEVAWQRRLVVSYGIGPKQMSQHYAYLSPRQAHVLVGFYRGAFLNDPDGLFQSTSAARSLRVLKVDDAVLAGSPALKRLLRQAISERLAARA